MLGGGRGLGGRRKTQPPTPTTTTTPAQVNGGDDDDPDAKPGTMDYVMHYLTLPWKLIFATVTPTQ